MTSRLIALVPLCLFRGPLNVFGLGAGVAGVLVSGGIYPMHAVVGLMASYNQVSASPTRRARRRCGARSTPVSGQSAR